MQIEIIQTTDSSILDSTKRFGTILNRILSNVKMCHWYSNDYNLHVLLGNLYDDLSDIFDSLQEEIIGTSKEYNSSFPMFNIQFFSDEELSDYFDDNSILENFNVTVNKLKDVLTSMEFNNYTESVKSGIVNTRDEIITRINKTNYLLSMVKI